MKLGDLVWVAEYKTTPVIEPCPVCYGNKEVKVTCGNGEEFMLDCDYCKRGWEGPTGVHKPRYDRQWSAKMVRIDKIEESLTEPLRIQSGHYIYYEKDIFSTEDEAMERAAVREAEMKEADEAKALEKVKPSKSYSWHVGYYKREIARLERELENRKESLRLAESKARKSK